MSKKYYLTTPLYYVNDVPHIGHAYTTIAADVLARWKRLTSGKENVFFLTGTDEHGAKIETAAQQHNLPAQEYVNKIAGEFKRLWEVLNISHDDFIQTSEERHKKTVQEIFEKLKSSGDIYKGTYEDWYCMQDESYYSEAELVNKKCPSCGRDVSKLKEDSYFFKLSKYEKPLLDHYQSNPDFLSPKHRASEIVNFVKSGLRDLSVSRSRVSWGVSIPSDPAHVVYVWFDALINYISSPGYHVNAPQSGVDPFNSIWPADVHLVGKEIFRFHTVIWPAMLMALGLPLPKKVFAHGWWTVEGTKMSKSLGNVVDPHKMGSEYGVDAFRYFLLREVNFGSDGDFSEKALLSRYNSELANNLGNLFQRTTTILVKQFQGRLPNIKKPSELISNPSEFIKSIDTSLSNLAFHDALETIFGYLVKANKYIDDQAPWKLGPEEKEKLENILYQCLVLLKTLSLVLWPIMPTKMQELWTRLGEKGTIELEGPKLLSELGQGKLPQFSNGQSLEKGDPLFMRKGGRWK